VYSASLRPAYPALKAIDSCHHRRFRRALLHRACLSRSSSLGGDLICPTFTWTDCHHLLPWGGASHIPYALARPHPRLPHFLPYITLTTAPRRFHSLTPGSVLFCSPSFHLVIVATTQSEPSHCTPVRCYYSTHHWLPHPGAHFDTNPARQSLATAEPKHVILLHGCSELLPLWILTGRRTATCPFKGNSRCRPCHHSPTACRRPIKARHVDSSQKLARFATRATGPLANVSTRRTCQWHVVLICTPDSSTVSQNMGLQVQTLLNPSDDSPSRNSIPDTPSSARYPSGLSHSSQVRRVSSLLRIQLT
jgi:hypothetical protein